MALTNYEKQKRWREKNRALYNFQQRQRRKNLSGDAEQREVESPYVPETKRALVSQDASPSQSSKISQLRELIAKESVKPTESPVATPVVFRDDYGRVISQAQWKRLQKLNQDAKDGGYERDEYSQ